MEKRLKISLFNPLANRLDNLEKMKLDNEKLVAKMQDSIQIFEHKAD
jgi:hypothetical protein